jgi:hypothetical protein
MEEEEMIAYGRNSATQIREIKTKAPPTTISKRSHESGSLTCKLGGKCIV